MYPPKLHNAPLKQTIKNCIVCNKYTTQCVNVNLLLSTLSQKQHYWCTGFYCTCVSVIVSTPVLHMLLCNTMRPCAFSARMTWLRMRRKLWSITAAAPFTHTHTHTLFPPGKEGVGVKVGVSEGGVFAPGRAWQLRSIGWQQRGGRFLPVPVGRSATRHRPTPNQDQLFPLLPAARRGRSRPARLGSEAATAPGLRAWSLSRRGARRESASGSKVRRNMLRLSSLFSCPLIASQVLWLGQVRNRSAA